MTAPTPQQLQDLALDLQVELRKLEHLVEGLASLGPVAVDPLRVDAAALRLQSLYTGIERCLVQISRVLNGGSPPRSGRPCSAPRPSPRFRSCCASAIWCATSTPMSFKPNRWSACSARGLRCGRACGKTWSASEAGCWRPPRAEPGAAGESPDSSPIRSPSRLPPMLLDLRGKKALVTGIANNKSIAWGIAQQLHAAGAELGVTYLPDEKGRFEGKVRDLTAPLAPTLFEPLNVQDPAQIEAVFARVAESWGSLDVLVHCLAFAGKEELIGDYSAISPEGFARALEVSAYSLAPLCRYAKPLFNDGASVITLSYLGAERAIPNYNVMGVAKAALEASVRYLAAELGPEKQVRVNAISAGPIRTLDMIHNVEGKAPLRRTVTQEEVGSTAAFLASPLASGITGQVIYVDAGYCITGM